MWIKNYLGNLVNLNHVASIYINVLENDPYSLEAEYANGDVDILFNGTKEQCEEIMGNIGHIVGLKE